MLHVAGKSKRGPWVAAALTAALFGATAGPPRAAEPTAPPLPEKKLTFRDIQLTVHARQALADDPVLGPANLGVRVQENVAVLWGPAPTEEARRRAVELVKKVKGVFEVRDADVYVAAPPPPVPVPIRTPPPPPPPTEGPTRTESDSPDLAAGALGALTGRPAVEAPSVVLGAPRSVGDKAPAQTVSAAPPEDLAALLLRAHLAEARFQAVDYRLEGDAVVLRMGAGRPEDMMAFARAIKHLPGLSRIEVLADDAAAPR